MGYFSVVFVYGISNISISICFVDMYLGLIVLFDPFTLEIILVWCFYYFYPNTISRFIDAVIPLIIQKWYRVNYVIIFILNILK